MRKTPGMQKAFRGFLFLQIEADAAKELMRREGSRKRSSKRSPMLRAIRSSRLSPWFLSLFFFGFPPPRGQEPQGYFRLEEHKSE